jgi:hypothetical protein
MATAPGLAPLPDANHPVTQTSGSASQGYTQWLQALDALVRGGNYPAVSVNGNAVLTVAGGQTLIGGFNETIFDFGSVTSGSITPNPSKSLKQHVTNNGSFFIAATAEIGDVELLITNGASAGALTFSGFTKQWSGDALDTVNGHQFIILIYGFFSVSAYMIKALQ